MVCLINSLIVAFIAIFIEIDSLVLNKKIFTSILFDDKFKLFSIFLWLISSAINDSVNIDFEIDFSLIITGSNFICDFFGDDILFELISEFDSDTTLFV